MQKFSIIIITLNEEKNIANILSNLAKQTYQNFEVIIADSNSTDTTQKEAEKFQDIFPEFRFIQMKARGTNLGRNTGARAAKYDNLLFFDADTQIDNDFLEKLVKQLSKIPNRKKLGGGTFFANMTSSHMMFNIGNALCNLGNIITSFSYPTCFGSCLFATKEAYNAVGGFNEALTVGEDSYFSTSIKKNGYIFKLFPIFFYFNPRRFEQDGTIKTLWKYMMSWFYHYIKKDTKQKIDYNFGHYNQKK